MALERIRPGSLFRLVRRFLHARPKTLARARTAVRGGRGLEIGGPSNVFLEWYALSPHGVTYPLYGSVRDLDNCVSARLTVWADHRDVYAFQPLKRPGKTLFCEGADLHEVPDAQYDFLLSSHALEHFANPVKALKEWQRVVRPGGTLVLILPHHEKTFDQGRPVTTVNHMLADYACGMGEDDQTHVDEILQARNLDPQSRETLREHLQQNTEHRQMHHHTFDEENSRGLLTAIGLKIIASETLDPCHVILIAQFPG